MYIEANVGQFICRIPVIRGGCISALVCFKMIQCCVGKILVFLMVPVEDLDWSSNLAEKGFFQMGSGGLVGGCRNLEFLPEFC